MNEKHVFQLVLEVDSNMSWTNIRYLLERKWFSKGRDFIVSVPDRNDHDILTDGTKLILKRIPLKEHQKMYIPQHILHPPTFPSNDKDFTEEEKIQKIMELAQYNQTYTPHPSKMIGVTSVPRIPGAHYACAYCFARGSHYVQDCPRKLKNLPARKLPAGLPKTFLRPAKTEEEKELAFITNDGQYVVFKNQHIGITQEHSTSKYKS